MQDPKQGPMLPPERQAGKVTLADGRTFVWMAGFADGEIWGGVGDPDGRPVSGTSGWWRTTDPEKAAECAALLYPATTPAGR